MPGDILQHFTRTRILNKPMNMQLLGDAQPQSEARGERRGGGRDFGGERRGGGNREGGREGGRRFSSERREGGREGGRSSFSREGSRGPRREEGAAAAPRRREF